MHQNQRSLPHTAFDNTELRVKNQSRCKAFLNHYELIHYFKWKCLSFTLNIWLHLCRHIKKESERSDPNAPRSAIHSWPVHPHYTTKGWNKLTSRSCVNFTTLCLTSIISDLCLRLHLFLWIWVFCLHFMYVDHEMSARWQQRSERSDRFPEPGLRWLWIVLWVLGTKPGSSKRTLSHLTTTESLC